MNYSRAILFLGALILPVALANFIPQASAAELKLASCKSCLECHKPEASNIVLGYLGGISFKAQMLQLKLDDSVETFYFDEDSIQVVNEERKSGDGELLRDNAIKKGHQVSVQFSEKNGLKTVLKLTAKRPEKTGRTGFKPADSPKPNKDEIGLDDFRKYAAHLPDNTMIVDLRPETEVKLGKLKVSTSIPLHDLTDRLSELPKHKLIIFQCSTGVQSEMAYNILKENGYTNVKYLSAKVKFEKDGSYTITSP